MKRRQFLAAMAGAAGLSAPVTSFAMDEMGALAITAEITVERAEDGSWRHVLTETVRRVRGSVDEAPISIRVRPVFGGAGTEG